MIFKNRHKWGVIICGMVLHLLLLSSKTLHAQCNQWDVTAAVETSTCAANGKITASLTGSNAPSLTNVLYSLRPLTPGGRFVDQSTSPVFENLQGGNYRVIVQALCNSVSVWDSVQVTVTTSYVPMNVTASQVIAALAGCNSGRADVVIASGSAPYTVTLATVPAGYSGRRTFTTDVNVLRIDSLKAGNYTISVTDACNATSPAQTLTIGNVANAGGVYAALVPVQDNNCSLVTFGNFGVYNGELQQILYAQNSPVEVSFTIGGVTSGYKPVTVVNTVFDTITLPGGKKISDYIGSYIKVNFRTACGNIFSDSTATAAPILIMQTQYNCNTNYNLQYYIGASNMACYPLYIALKNKETNHYRYDTVKTYNDGLGTRSIKGLAFGDYTISVVDANGKVATSNWGDEFSVTAPGSESPYALSMELGYGASGYQGHAFFSVYKSSLFTPGTKIELVSPADQRFSFIVNDETSGTAVYKNNELAFFGVGSYLFRITDNCGSYDMPVTIRQQDVYKYIWKDTTIQTCDGLGLTVTGEAYYQNQTLPLYYSILSPNQYYRIVPAGQQIILPLPGTYQIGVSGSTSVQEFPGINTFTVEYKNNALGIDTKRSIGWVCPSRPKDLGTIWAYGVNGVRSSYGSGYTFQLAEEGNGATGPYLATNNTGIFTATSNGPFKLTANKTYEVRISDSCGASAIQPIKIIDYATAQVISTERAEYCIGETVSINVLNLPTDANRFFWKYPNGVEKEGQAQLILKNFQVKDTGTYKITITSDMCDDPIVGSVHVGVAPYLEICYSAVTDTSVNPYKYSLLGNWRPVRSYVYYTARAESDPNQPTNIRTDGAYAEYESFWTLKNGKWSANKAENWVWNSESTIFNAKGFELENKDPLGRFNAGLYGYADAIPTAVVQNSRYQEAAYEGFEDYYFGNGACEGPCPTGRRFDFSIYKGRIDSTQKHTGRYSIRVAPGDTVGVVSTVMATPVEQGLPTFNETTVQCGSVTSTVLKSIRANSDVIMPSFAPLSGKQILFTAWVKEIQDCSCTSYTSNEIGLAVQSNSGSTVLKIKPTGAIIDGWQRYEQVVDLPAGSTGFSVVLMATGSTTVFYDDIRVHPYNANMKSFVYDARNLRMMAELDENNYATFFEYDDDATLTRVKKETERGVKTIKETRSALIKE
ncbi:hypothetical protein [Chitinophaga agri]|uniref:Ig-like domain-containing protein n=1 Tax=Chitinophaga agri TaxID=2703787 RepID=A0A6B9Z9Q8_9BACT|nr:hypothetical protein [Chitinophaga agri]QHS58599.1 hypothetical protein GWR21_03000 [Chitinophaga agri]